MAAQLVDPNWTILRSYGLPAEVAAEAGRLVPAYQAGLEPADAEYVRVLLGKLVVHLPDRNRPEELDAMVFDDYLRVLRYPKDIWDKGYDEALRRHTWFPKIAELRAIMSPLLIERMDRRTRLEMIAFFGSKPKPYVRSPEEVAGIRNQVGGLRRLADFWPKVRAALKKGGAG